LYFFLFLQIMSTDQMTVQRYSAMKTDREARKGVILGAFSAVSVWLYFTFVGTALYVFYNHFPTPELSGLAPEQVFPFFILTQMPAGLAGLIVSGLLAAAMSTLDSSINASAATVTTDFYRRLFAPDREEAHYVRVGRWLSVAFGAVMIGAALTIYLTRTETLMDLQSLLMSILSGGLLGLFLLGFLTRRVDSRSAAVATVCVVAGVCLWVFVGSETGTRLWPALAGIFPDRFWIIVLANVALLGLGYLISWLPRKGTARDLKNLTVWTQRQRPRTPSDRHQCSRTAS
jgi:SSS family solute:Na+ symporter